MHNLELSDVDFGKILNDLISVDEITDIEIRPNSCSDEIPFSIWTVDVKNGRKRIDLGLFCNDHVNELHSVITKISRQLAIRMEVSYNEGNAILDAESEYKGKALLRINSIHESLTESNSIPLIAIRKSSYYVSLNKRKLIESSYCSEDFFDLLETLIKANCNIIIAGQTGAGKTSLLKYLCRYIDDCESIITIEDTREAFLEKIYPNKDIGSLKSSKEYNFESLVKTSLRQNMDWLLVSEVRGREVVDLLDAVGSGHFLISTIHSDSAANIPYRIANLAKVGSSESERIYLSVYNEIDLGIYINYYNDRNGSHRQIQEVVEFFVDDLGSQKCHTLYHFDFQTNDFVIEKIKSIRIMNKINRKRIDTSKIKRFL